MTKFEKILHTARIHTTGGRDGGKTRTNDGRQIDRNHWRCVSALLFIGVMALPLAAQSGDATPARNIVLVHGAWADGSSWDKVVPILEGHGYHVVAVHEPLTSLSDDVGAVNRTVDAQNGPVILVGHSWGGAVISEAGNNPRVVGLVYVDAFALDTGESVNSFVAAAGAPPEWAAKLQVDHGGFLTLPKDVVLKDFAQDLPASQANLLAAKQGPIFSKSFDDKVMTPAWKTKPSWYVLGSQDRIIPPAGQTAMAERMHATVTSVPSSHVSMLSHSTEVAAVIERAATAMGPK